MKTKTRFLFSLMILLYSLFLFLNLFITAFFYMFDEYYLSPTFDDPAFRTKDFNISFYSWIIPIVLTILVTLYVGKKIKKNYILIALSYLISYVIYKITYLKILIFFSVTNNPFINIGIISILFLILILVSYKYLMKMKPPQSGRNL